MPPGAAPQGSCGTSGKDPAPPLPDVRDRPALLRRGVLLQRLTIGYNGVEGVIAIAAGVLAGSVALTGFGVDSAIEVSSGVLVLWRLRAELGSPLLGATAERRASRGAGALLLGLAGYIVIEAGRDLITGARPETSLLGIALTSVSLVLMPLLARAKFRTADLLDSRALRADAHETLVCAWLSLTTLAGLGLNAGLGWWWADPAAALVMLPLIVREGLEAWRGEPADDPG